MSPISLTEEMQILINNALDNGTPCILATASPQGEPGVSYRGSMMAFDDQHLAYWERTRRLGLEHISKNSKVVVMFRDPERRKSWKFYGHATVYMDSEMREKVMARVVESEISRDPNREGFAVVISVDRITDFQGNVLQER